ncbi:MAG: FG-GAP-like repeat-containing protein, partial [Gemmataceae bacterium]|nr:FG-GAP-like repeat-containing protein [Gemmataceae bacterium]
WSINPVTGQFDDVGDGRVSADGRVIETISGGIRNSSWHFFTPPPQPRAVDPKTEPANEDKKCDPCKELLGEEEGGTSQVELHSGAYLEAHSLVTYFSLGQTRGVRLVYDSERADPRPIITAGYDDAPASFGPIRLVGRLTILHGNVAMVVPGHPGGEFGLRGGEHFWTLPATLQDVRVSLQADLRAMPTGRYGYAFETGLLRFNGTAFVGSTSTQTGDFIHINTIHSPIGAGWGIAGLIQLFENADGSVLYVNGDGSEMVFERLPNGTYDAPPGNFSTLVKNPDGSFTQTFPDQRVLQFNTAGRIVSETDRNGNQTRWEYDVQGQLVRWIDPVGLITHFAYANGRLTSITDPAGRVTRFEHDAAGNLTRITDPDGTSRQFEYDGRHHLVTEVDKRGYRETTIYGEHGRVEQLIRRDGGITRIQPVQTQNLRPASETAQHGFRVVNGQVIDDRAVPVRIRGADLPAANEEASYVDPRGNVFRHFLDQGGQFATGRDQVGSQERVVRNADNLVVQQFDARGNRTDFTYDARGNLLTIDDEVSRAARRATIPGLFPSLYYMLPELGGHPQHITVRMADFNNDGFDDVFVAIHGSNSFGGVFNLVSVFLADGRGGLQARQDTTVPTSLRFNDAEVADFNRDGKMDVVVAGNPVSVLYGNGNGTFTVVSLGGDAGGTHQPLLAVADLDLDGDIDIVGSAGALPSHGATVIYRNNGDGTFGPRTVVAGQVGFRYGLEVGDLTGDGRPEIVFRHDTSTTIQEVVLRANADGSYTTIRDARESFGGAFTLVDATGDGRLDIVGTRLVRNNGDETFTDLGFYLTADQFIVRDLDGDGRQDLVRMFYDGNAAEVWLEFYRLVGAGFQRLAFRNLGGDSAYSVAIGDVNGDGLLDVAAASSSNFHHTAHQQTAINLLVNQGGYQFPGEQIQQPSEAIVVADFNEDGVPDLLAAARNVAPTLRLGTGNGSFGPPTPVAAARDVEHYTIAAGDLDGDGHLDAVMGLLVGNTAPQVSLLFGNGDGTFAPRVERFADQQIFHIELHDLDRDGDLDVFAKGTQAFLTLRNDGNRQFTPVGVTPFTSIGNSAPVSLGDLDGDGFPDLVLSHPQPTPGVRLYRGRGDGTFELVRTIATTFFDTAMLLRDVTGDGRRDLIVARSPSGITTPAIIVYPGDGTVGFNNSVPYTAIANQTFQRLVSADVNLDGHLDLLGIHSSSERVTVMLNDGTGRFNVAARVQIADTGMEYLGSADDWLEVADLDLDGDPDFVVGGARAQTVSIRLNNTISNGVGDGPGRKVFTYDPVFSQLTSVTDELGHRRLIDIDPANGNPIRETRVIGQLDSPQNGETDDLVTQRTFNTRGQVLTETDPRGHVTAYEYDAFGRVMRITYAHGTPQEASRRFEYDAAGNVTAEIDELGRRTEFEYDPMNRVTVVRDALGQETRFTYDANGNRVTEVDRRGNTTTSTYDALDRRVTIVDALGGVRTTTYDALGNVTSETDELGRTTRYVYDSRNRLVEKIDPAGGRETYRYDADGNQIRVTDERGHATKYAYDARNRQIRMTDPTGAVTTTTYDAADRLIQTIDPLNRRTRYQYDDVNRLVRTTNALGGVTTNTYDKAGNLVATTDEIGRTWQRTYDPRNRLVTTVDPLGGVRQYVYDAANQLVAQVDELGRTITTAYDQLGRVTSLTDAVGNATTFTHDANGNVTSQTDRRGFTTQYEYDALNRRIRQIDALGNITTTTYDAVGQVIAETDALGRTTRREYDSRGNLVRVVDPRGNATTFAYDAASNRIRET